MYINIHRGCFLFVLLILLMIQGCVVEPDPEPVPPATLVDFGWVIENIDPSFWTESTGSGHLYYNFFINYSGSMTVADITTSRVYFPSGNTWWTLNPQYYLDTDQKVLGGFGRWYLDTDPNALPLGNLTAEVVFTNGTKSSVILNVPECGSTSNPSGYGTIKSEDDLTIYPSGTSTTVIPRPTTISASKSTTNLTVSFTLGDNRINNGWVWLYNSNHQYLGGFFYFNDKQTGGASSYLNNGSGIGTASTNSLIVPISACTSGSGSPLNIADVAECIVVVTDGRQYASRGSGHYTDHDCRAYSARTPFY